MKNPIKDIKRLGPGDKLIILSSRYLKGVEIAQIKKTIEKFIEDEKDKFLIISNFDVYIMRKGAKILLKDALNKEIKDGRLTVKELEKKTKNISAEINKS